MSEARYISLKEYLAATYGEKLYRVSIDTGLSCPNRDGSKGDGGCTYCAPQMLKPANTRGVTNVKDQLEIGMEAVGKRYGAKNFIAYFQLGSNTYGPTKELKAAYQVALDHPKVRAIAISTRPDCLPGAVLDLLAEINFKKETWIELGLQSSNNATLARINRGHSAEEFAIAAESAAKRGLKVCAHMILGLPEEERDDALATADFIASLPIWGIKFHHLQVINNTPLEMQYALGRLRLLTLDEYTSLVVECLERLRPGTIVHRLIGESPRSRLIAPRWNTDKQALLAGIDRLLEERDTRVGTRCRFLISNQPKT